LVASVAVTVVLLAGTGGHTPASPIFANPFELLPALKLGVLIAGVMLLSKVLYDLAGDAGLYIVAAASGLADVDSITVSSGQLAQGGAAVAAAGAAVLVAVASNSLAKGAMVASIERGRAALFVALGYLATLLAGGVALAAQLTGHVLW